MLNLFRTFARSFIAKLFLGVIVLSFIIAGGISSSGLSGKNVATVDDQNIPFLEFYNEYQQNIQSLGLKDYPKEGLRQMDFAQNVLNSIISRKLIQVETSALNLGVSDEMLAEKIQNTKYFQRNGKFDKNTFNRALRASGYNEDSYIDLLKKDLISERYTSSIVSVDFAMPNLANLLALALEQKRNGLVAKKSLKSIKTKKSKDSDVQTHYSANQEEFRVSEMRDISALVLSAKAIETNITKKDVKKHFKANKDSYAIAETRSFYNITGSIGKLMNITADVKSGKSLKKSVQTHLEKPLKSFLKKDVKKSDIVEYIGNAAFNTKAKTFSNIQSGAFGTSVIWVKSIKKSSMPKFSSVKKKIKTEMANEKLIDFINTAEDSISAGATIEEVAKKLKLKIENVSNVSINGGKPAFTKDARFTKEIFQIQEGETSMMIESADSNYALARVNKITETYIPALKDIKSKVLKSYKKRVQNTLLQEQLTALNAAESASEFKKKAKKFKFKVTKLKNLKNIDAKKSKINTILFKNNLNKANSLITEGYGYSVFTTNVNTPKKASEKTLNNTLLILKNDSQSSAYKAIINALTKKYSIEINKTLLNSVYE